MSKIKREIEIKNRTLEEARYFIDNQATVRSTSEYFSKFSSSKISKSTIHKDLVKRLPLYSHTLAKEVQAILEKNKEERAVRGGIATGKKYKKIKVSK